MNVNDLKDKTPIEQADNLPNVYNISTIPVQIAAQAYLRAALNKELIDSQREYQDKSIKQMRNLVRATWALVFVSIIVPVIAPIIGRFIYWMKNLIR